MLQNCMFQGKHLGGIARTGGSSHHVGARHSRDDLHMSLSSQLTHACPLSRAPMRNR